MALPLHDRKNVDSKQKYPIGCASSQASSSPGLRASLADSSEFAIYMYVLIAN